MGIWERLKCESVFIRRCWIPTHFWRLMGHPFLGPHLKNQCLPQTDLAGELSLTLFWEQNNNPYLPLVYELCVCGGGGFDMHWGDSELATQLAPLTGSLLPGLRIAPPNQTPNSIFCARKQITPLISGVLNWGYSGWLECITERPLGEQTTLQPISMAGKNKIKFKK